MCEKCDALRRDNPDIVEFETKYPSASDVITSLLDRQDQLIQIIQTHEAKLDLLRSYLTERDGLGNVAPVDYKDMH